MYRCEDWQEGYYIDNHEKYECGDCGGQFIVGEETKEHCEPGFPVCPYCGQKKMKRISWTEDAELEMLASDMGCLAIYVDKGGETE